MVRFKAGKGFKTQTTNTIHMHRFYGRLQVGKVNKYFNEPIDKGFTHNHY